VTVTFLTMNNILIVGTGALACLYAARLTQSGHHITMLGTWKEGLNALHKDGVRLIDSNGDEQGYVVHVTDNPKECIGTKYAIVLVKAWQTDRAAHQLAECLADDGLAITLQNGLGNYETLVQVLDLATHLPWRAAPGETIEKTREKNSENSVRSVARKVSRVALGTTTTGATLLGAGWVRAGGEGIISIGRHPAIGPMEAALRSANFNVQIVDDPQSLIWGKLVINAAINPALLKITNGELLERPAARELMGQLAREAAEVARAENIKLNFDDPIAAVEQVAQKTSMNQSSMLQDVLRGAPTEIDAICGEVVQRANKHNLKVPANEMCWKLIKALETA